MWAWIEIDFRCRAVKDFLLCVISGSKLHAGLQPTKKFFGAFKKFKKKLPGCGPGDCMKLNQPAACKWPYKLKENAGNLLTLPPARHKVKSFK